MMGIWVYKLPCRVGPPGGRRTRYIETMTRAIGDVWSFDASKLFFHAGRKEVSSHQDMR
jgi:hypothetical protein